MTAVIKEPFVCVVVVANDELYCTVCMYVYFVYYKYNFRAV